MSVFSKHKGNLKEITKELDIAGSHLQDFINSLLFSIKPSSFKKMLEISKTISFSYDPSQTHQNTKFKYYKFSDKKR